GILDHHTEGGLVVKVGNTGNGKVNAAAFRRKFHRVATGDYRAKLDGIVVGKTKLRSGNATVHAIEIVDYGTSELEYMQILYDRVPSLPQRLTHDYSTLEHLWRNIAFRIARTVR
ncbi:MAG: hypothetical protein IJ092_09210, partial [Atopobiaceae bacterium]|nr:hypothetical protein [Atopobiaceae bacterium]